jgi:hypothetical protein
MSNLIKNLCLLFLSLSSFTAVSGVITINTGTEALFSHYTWRDDGSEYGESIHHPSQKLSTLNDTFQLTLNDLTPKNYQFYFYGGCGDDIVCSAMGWQYHDVQWHNLATSSASLLCNYAGLSAEMCPQVVAAPNTTMQMGHSNGYDNYDDTKEPFSSTSGYIRNDSKRTRQINELTNEITIVRMYQYFGLYSELATTPTWGSQFKVPTSPELWDWLGGSSTKTFYHHTMQISNYRCDNVLTLVNCQNTSSENMYLNWNANASFQPNSVSAPATSACVLLGLAGLAWRRRRSIH